MICALGATRKSILERKKSIYDCPLYRKTKNKKKNGFTFMLRRAKFGMFTEATYGSIIPPSDEEHSHHATPSPNVVRSSY